MAGTVTLLCDDYPYLRILAPDGSYRQFQGGKLEIEKDDLAYDAVMGVAVKMPSIRILSPATSRAEARREVKASAEFACDVCSPAQTFPDAEALAEHTQMLHTAVSPAEVGDMDTSTSREVSPASVPAAKRTGGGSSRSKK